MRTNFQLKNRSKSKYSKSVLIAVAIFIFGAIFFSFTDGGFLRILTPIWSGKTVVGQGLNNLVLFFRTKDYLIEENQALKDRIKTDAILLVSTQTLTTVHGDLLNALGRTAYRKGITAAVLVRPPETPYDILVIDVGTDEGVEVGGVVTLSVDSMVGGLGPKVGEIIEVFKKNSKVKLYSANGEKTNAVLERDTVPVVLLGRGGGNFEFILSREIDVVVGDKILSADIGRALMGVVRDVEMSTTDSFKKVLVISVLNIYTENFVTVIK